ncbi:dipeptide/oligopeptide/nickel ABC transporter permease [Acetobacter tropicalis NRIC 0312]|uniref:ABC transporter permease n=1 Tax=Acetobacter tropicalis TaxID=104102 RepID=A0A0C9LI79_9PROT|nr:ABC transporter permease [Acetobacter tropicalis]KXV55766.1 ABC transporter permease [Acetobacter tropicalis]GAL99288.1 ABC transporter permease [Acetobacter tropicalis]GBR67050.1 dipeptide/oligopeptide/nickel ABC transporter permease [Acetobacter tropicalis NRIC 0312]
MTLFQETGWFFLKKALIRIGGACLVLFAAATLTFIALHLAPGDPVTAILGGSANPTPETIQEIRQEYGLDQPIMVQYGLHVWRVLSGQLGSSFSQHMPVTDVLWQQAPHTLKLMLASLITAWVFAVLSVTLSARKPIFDSAFSSLETLFAGLPQFWIGIMLLWLFAYQLGLLPPAGTHGFSSLILPTLSLAIPLGGFLAQVMRESFKTTLDQPFVLTARSRGVSDNSVRFRHVLRHALLPGVSLSTWAIGALVGNVVPVEVVFSRQGLGRQLFLAVSMHDMPLVTGIILFIALVYVLASFLADVLYVIIDPRIQEARV